MRSAEHRHEEQVSREEQLAQGQRIEQPLHRRLAALAFGALALYAVYKALTLGAA